jgi:hypothetical protein
MADMICHKVYELLMSILIVQYLYSNTNVNSEIFGHVDTKLSNVMRESTIQEQFVKKDYRTIFSWKIIAM